MISPLARGLFVLGIVCFVSGIGVVLWTRFGLKLPFRLGALPGDFTFRSGNATFSFPLATCLLLSIFLTIVFNLIARFLK